MTEPAHPPDLDEREDDDDDTWSVSEIAQLREFQIPASIGLVVSVVALLTDSPYAWVITFGYLMLGLPGLIFFLRERPKPERDQSWRKQNFESEADRAVRARLQTFLGQRFAHEEEVERGLAHYDQAQLLCQELLQRVRYEDSPELLDGRKKAAEIITRLGKCAHLCSQLATLDSTQLVKRMQTLSSKGNLNDYDRAELQSLMSKIEARDGLLSNLIDHLRANDRLLVEIARLAQAPRA